MDFKEIDAKKKDILIGVAAVLLIVIIAMIFIIKNSDKDGETDDSGQYIGDEDMMDVGVNNYYAGVVEAQKIVEFNKDEDKNVAQIHVAVGDEVTEGQALFTYDTAEMALKLEQTKIELDSVGNDITDYQNQINNLKNEMNGADQTLKLEYQMQIAELSTNIKQAQLSQKTKQAEIDSMTKSIENATVNSTLHGVVKSVNQSSDGNGAFLSVVASGTYRIKGTVDEMHVGSFSEGMPVTVHSRVDDNTWKGSIEKIDTEEKAEDAGQSGLFGESDSEENSTKYYFYVALENGDGLLLGQHVFVEPLFEEVDSEVTEDTAVDAEGEQAGNNSGEPEGEPAGSERNEPAGGNSGEPAGEQTGSGDSAAAPEGGAGQ